MPVFMVETVKKRVVSIVRMEAETVILLLDIVKWVVSQVGLDFVVSMVNLIDRLTE
jgi:hypothetical protein